MNKSIKYFQLLLLVLSSVFMACKKDKAPEPEVYRTFDLGMSWNDRPQVFKAWNEAILMGIPVSQGANASYRFVHLDKEGELIQSITRKNSEYFDGYTTVYSNLSLNYETDKLFLSALCVRNEGINKAYYLVVKELNSALNIIQTIEKKILIGGLAFDSSSKFFFTPCVDGYFMSINIIEPSGKSGVYQELLDEEFSTLSYWKKGDYSFQAMRSNDNKIYAYGYTQENLPNVYAFDLAGNLLWMHSMQFTNPNPSLLSIKEVRFRVNSSGMMLAFASNSANTLPILTYKIGFNGAKISEQSLALLEKSFLNFVSGDQSIFYYAGQTCSAPNSCKPFWAKYDDDLNLIFSKLLPENFNHKMSALYVNETESGYSIFGLKDDFSSTVPEAFFLKTNKEGNLVSQ